MALPATEDFTGAAAALSGTWTQQLATTINKNGSGLGVQSAIGSGNPNAFWNADVFNNAQYSQIVPSAFNSNFVEPTVRASGTGSENFYGHYSNGVTTGVEKAIGGTFTDLGAASASPAAGDTQRLEVSGTTLTSRKNGASTGTYTDGALTSGSAGIASNAASGTAPTFDTWQGDNLVAASAAMFSYSTRRAPGQRGPFDQRGFLLRQKFDYTPSAAVAPPVTILQRKTLSQTGNHTGGRQSHDS